ncbi:MAG: hypothetical protein EHM40_01550 [Chloroflexi bacterium]|nr:MAG: hypothetical protein EHM40_01550 [Chloroflexota bacterium]
MVLLNLIPFTLSTWLGLFLLGRGAHPRLRLTGLGLLFYAAALEISVPNLSSALRLLPPVLWVGAILYLDQRIIDGHPILFALWKWILLPVTILLGGFFLFEPTAASTFPFLWISLLIGLTPLFWTLSLVPDYKALLRPRQVTGVLFTATLFFALGEAFLFFPSKWLPPEIALPAIGIDLLFLGFCIAWFDAFDEGETLLPSMLRSLALTLILVLIFAGQIGFVIAIQTGLTGGMRLLLTTTVFASALIAVFGNSLEARLDGFAFSRARSVREARARLVTESAILSRKDPQIDLSALSEEERSRLTRRALSHFGNLTRLASSPLTQLPAIEGRLTARGAPDTTLERAAELKLLLTQSILKLKPQNGKEFDTTDEWRFYNALFFPYVKGLRPYSRSQEKSLADFEKEAVDWFRAFVPERTLHNWQNAGARLIANELWESNFE